MKIKTELKNLLVYGMGNISQHALNFLLLPLYLKLFSPAQYGVINILWLVCTFISIFASAGLMSALHRQYFLETEIDKRILPGVMIVWYMAASVIIGSIIVAFSGNICLALFSNTTYVREIKLLSLIIPLTLIVDIPYNIFRLEKQSVRFAVFSIVKLLLDVILKFLFIVVLGRSVLGFFESTVISLCIVNFIIFFLTKDNIKLNVDVNQLKKLLTLGFPFVFTGFSIWSLGAIDRFLINFFIDESAVGVYSTGAKFSQIFNIVLYRPISLLLPPTIFAYIAKHTDAENKAFFVKLLNILIVAGGAFTIVVSIASADIIKILVTYFGTRSEYLESIPIIPYLTLGNFFYYLGMPAGYVILMIKKTKIPAIVSLFAAIGNVILNCIFISILDELGAAVATFISFFLYTSGVYYFTHRVYQVGYNVKSILLEFVFIILIVFLFQFVNIPNPVVSLVTRVVSSCILFIAITWFFSGIFDKATKERIVKAKLFTK